MVILQARSRWLLMSMAVLGLCCDRPVFGQVLMLPTQRNFSASTSVLVPDRGMTHLGSISRAREGSITRGIPGLAQLPMAGRLFRNQAIGRDLGHTGASVTATIIDLRELDEQVLSRVRVPVLSAEEIQQARKADFLSRNIARQGVPLPSVPVRVEPRSSTRSSVAEIRRQNQLAAVQRQQEAEEYLQRARQLDAQGKTGVARIYYQMAARRTTGKEQQVILDRLRTLNAQRSAGAAERP